MTSVSPQQLSRYGLLALAGLSAEAAHAGVVTSTSLGFVPFTITRGDVQAVDFGNGIGSPFQFFAAPRGGSTTSYGSVVPPAASFVLQTGGAAANRQFINTFSVFGSIAYPGSNVRRLAANYVISAGRGFISASSAGTNNDGNDIGGYGGDEFNNYTQPGATEQGFIGVRFSSSTFGDTDFRYGFFDVTYNNTPNSDNGALTINGFAYETDANGPITTFTITGGAAAAPEPSSLLLAGLGLLSCGGAGIRSLRAQTKANEARTTTGVAALDA